MNEETFWIHPLDDRAPHPRVAVGHRIVGLVLVCAVLFGLATLVGFAANAAAAPPGPMRIVHTLGTLVEIPAAIPHEAGDMIDSRIVPATEDAPTCGPDLGPITRLALWAEPEQENR